MLEGWKEAALTVYILAAARTPVGTLGGSLRTRSAVELGAALLRGLLERCQPGPGAVTAVILGQAVQAGAGPNPALATALAAGLSPGVVGFTLNQGAASGLQAVIQAGLGLGDGLALAGGMESASGAPYLLPSARWGTRMGSAPVLDALLQDGPAGAAVADRTRAWQAQQAGLLAQEILPLHLPRRNHPGFTLDRDDALAEPPTPGQGPAGPGDGAAALLLCPERLLGGRTPLARILGSASGATGAQAIQHVLERAGLALAVVDRFELGPDIDPVPLGIAPGRLNQRGGAQALGDTPGADGARMLVSLIQQLRQDGCRYGLAALEAAPGFALAMLLENS